MLVRFEWLLFEAAVLGWAIYELISIRRSIRRDKAKRGASDASRDPQS